PSPSPPEPDPPSGIQPAQPPWTRIDPGPRRIGLLEPTAGRLGADQRVHAEHGRHCSSSAWLPAGRSYRQAAYAAAVFSYADLGCDACEPPPGRRCGHAFRASAPGRAWAHAPGPAAHRATRPIRLPSGVLRQAYRVGILGIYVGEAWSARP